MTVHELEMTPTQRIEEYKTSYLWHLDKDDLDTAMSYKSKLVAEIGQQATDAWIAAATKGRYQRQVNKDLVAGLPLRRCHGQKPRVRLFADGSIFVQCEECAAGVYEKPEKAKELWNETEASCKSQS